MKTCIVLLLAAVFTAIECSAQSTIVPYNFTTIAGELEIDGAGGYANGANSSAQFDFPEGMAMDSAGNLYVADKNNQVIRKMTHVGTNWVVSLLAGQPGVIGNADSTTATSATFNGPRGVAVDAAGNVYIADSGNNLIRELTPAGVVSTIAGVYMTEGGLPLGGYVNGPAGLQSQFSFPTGVAVDASNNLYVADNFNCVIRKMTKSSSLDIWEVSTLAGSGTPNHSADGTGTNADFNYPWGVAADSAGNVYVADTDNNEIRKITPAGVVSTLAGSAPTATQLSNYYTYGLPYPNKDGTGPAAGFFGPSGVAVDSAGNVFVADTYNCEIRKVTPEGVVTTLGGQPSFKVVSFVPTPVGGYGNGAGSLALFYTPIGVVVDNEGNLYVGDTDNCVIREGTAPVVQAVAIEVTQVIQDWNNSVTLIQGKDTYVRVHLQLPPDNFNPVMVTGAQLHGFSGTGLNGAALPGPPLTPINPGASLNVQYQNASDPIVRGAFANSLNFRLPPAWLTGTITLQAVWPGGLVPTNVLPNNCSVTVKFEPAGVPQVNFFAVNWTDATGTPHQVNQAIFHTLADRVVSCFPVAKIAADYDYSPLSVLYTGSQPTEQAVEDALYRYRNAANLPASQNQIYHGVVPVDAKSAQAISGNTPDIPGPVSYSLMVGTSAYGDGRQTVSHELGHNLGLYHDVSPAFDTPAQIGTVNVGACGNNEIGPPNIVYPLFQPFDGYPNGVPTLGPMTLGSNSMIYGLDALTVPAAATREPVLCPTNNGNENYYFDLMSYCRPMGSDDEDSWPSSITYQRLLNSINANYPPASPTPQARGGTLIQRAKTPKPVHPQVPEPHGGGESYLIVQGKVDFGAGTARFLPCLPLTTMNTPPTEPAGTNFLLRALDGTGAVLQTAQFTIQPGIYAENATNQTADFTVFLTADPAIHTLDLSYNGALLATITASPTAPALTLTTPNGGETFTTNTISIAWSGSDADGDTLTYTVEYSADDGTTWQPLALDLPGESLAVDSSVLAATTQGLIRVIASDGFNSTIAQSAATFTVPPHAPSVTIKAPLASSIFIADQQVFLDASANDMQDGALTGTNVQWYSDRDGALGSGTIVNFDAMILSEGNHTITVTATDNEGLTNSAVTQILVLHYQPPQLSFQVTPGIPGFYASYGTISWPSYYTNYVLQSSANLTSGWTSVTNPSPALAGNQQTVNVGVSNKVSLFRLLLQP